MGEHDVPEINAGYIRVSESIPERILANIAANSEDNTSETVNEITQHIAVPTDFDASAEIAVSHETICNMISSTTRSAIDSLISSVSAAPSTYDEMIDRIREIEEARTDDVIFRHTVYEEPADNRTAAAVSSRISDMVSAQYRNVAAISDFANRRHLNAEWIGTRESSDISSERQRLHYTVMNITIINNINDLDRMERRPGTLVIMANGERTWISDVGGRFCELRGNVQLTTREYGYASVEADEIIESEPLRNRYFVLDENDPRLTFMNAFREKNKTPGTCDECGAPVKNRTCVYCHKRF